MRLNLPVTSQQYEISDTETIVSTTDLHGNITYANPYFVLVSGFTEAELIGQPQNIVRHPDMPVEAFADLWATVKAGLPWTGLVKNRCKNGDFYWVEANVTPVIEQGQTVGYMSVRTKPTADQVAGAARLYQDLQKGNPGRMAIRQGAAVKDGALARLAALSRVSLGKRIALTSMLMVATLLALTFISSRPGWLMTLSAVSIGAMFYLWRTLESAVLAPVRLALRASRTMAGGDLTGQSATARTDEVGQLLRTLSQLRVNLHSIVGDVRRNSERIGVSTREIAAGNLNLSGRTESQAAALEQTASSMEELAATVQQNTSNAQQATTLANDASAVAGKGGAVVSHMLGTMQEISDSSRKIIDIIGMIEGIAFQTNILALNAAVEAARAGEQGRGFAVVAAEVRNLAQRSSAAARDIKDLIDVSIGKVGGGMQLAQQAGQTMHEIIASVHSVTVVMNEIAAASREQSAGIGQVNQAVTQMDQVTQQNAALVEEAAAAAASLEQQTRVLVQALSVFKLDKRDAPIDQRKRIASQADPALVLISGDARGPANPSGPRRPAMAAAALARCAASAPRVRRFPGA